MPNRTSVSPIYSEEFMRKVVAAFKTDPAAALAPNLMCRLIKQLAFNPTPASVEADFVAVEADFTDYVEKAVTLIEPANVGADVEGAIATVNYNMVTDPVVVENTVYGYFLESDGVIVCSEMFAEGQSVNMANVGDYLTMNLILPIQDYQSVL